MDKRTETIGYSSIQAWSEEIELDEPVCVPNSESIPPHLESKEVNDGKYEETKEEETKKDEGNTSNVKIIATCKSCNRGYDKSYGNKECLTQGCMKKFEISPKEVHGRNFNKNGLIVGFVLCCLFLFVSLDIPSLGLIANMIDGNESTDNGIGPISTLSIVLLICSCCAGLCLWIYSGKISDIKRSSSNFLEF